ncbi:MAG: hypothetical protein ACKVTZ_19590 [Bacteroidia bacterium]
MTSQVIWLYLSVILMSTVKFIGGIIISYSAKMNFWEIFLTNTIGTIIGLVIFGKGGEWIEHWLHNPWFREKYTKVKKFFGSFIKWKRKPTPFSRKKRMVKFWNKYGIWGLMVITPFILAPPLAVGVALSFREKSERFIPILSIGCVVWSLIAALFKEWILWVMAYFS